MILITGGAGFIGSHLSGMFLESNQKVAVVDNFSYGKREYLPLSNTDLTVLEHDILDQQGLERIFKTLKPELIIHLAAIHHIPTCELDPTAALRVNVEGTVSVMESCRKHEVRKVIFASSGAVYDTIDETLLEDQTPVVPKDIYSISKACGEDLLRLYTERGHFRGITCRLFNAVGPGETNAHLVPEILQQIKAGKDEIVLGNLQTHRSYIHVKDVAEAIFRLSRQEIKKKYDVFNIGNETEYTAADLMDMISYIAGKKFRVIQSPAKKRSNDRPHQKAGMKKLSDTLGWLPSRSIESALREAFSEIVHHA
jgi:UDP-glucose 4-epimerase